MSRRGSHTGRGLLPALLLLASSAVGAGPLTVTIEGVDGELADNVRGLLSLTAYEGEELTPARLRSLLAGTPEDVTTALQPFGYYQPEVETELASAPEADRVIVRVTPGQRTQIDTLDIRIEGPGREDATLQQQAREFPLQPGEPVLHADYESGKRELRRYALDRGYLDAKYRESVLAVQPEAQRAEIRLRLASGERYRFGEIDLQQDVLRESLLRRYLPFTSGDYYSTDELLSLQTRLYNTGYYELVEIEPLRDQGTAGSVPIVVRMTPEDRHLYRAGIGFATDTGPRVSLGYENRRINDRGHRWTSDAQISGVRVDWNTRYYIPIDDPTTDSLSFAGGVRSTEIENRSNDILALGIARLNVFDRWQRTLKLDLERETYDFGPAFDEDDSVLLLPGMGWTYARIDDVRDPTRGFRWSLETIGALEQLLSDATFLQATSDTRYLRQLWPNGRVILRNQLGATLTGAFDDLPLSKRFYTGGDYTVRGYDYLTLGERDDSGSKVGGKYLATASAEYEHYLRGNLGAAVFYDVGSAFTTFDKLFSAPGVGLRYKTPVGPVRFDIAFPLDAEAEDSFRLHLTLGTNL